MLKWGRGTGKGRCAVWDGVKHYFEWVNDEVPQSLVPRLHFGTLAPTYEAAFQPWAEMKEFILRIDRQIKSKGGPGILDKILNDEKKIYLLGDGVWELQSSDRPESLLGRGYDWLWITEAPYHPDNVFYNVVQPMLRRQDRHNEACFEGRPLGPDSYFEKLFNLGQDLDNVEVVSSHRTTFDNPNVDHAALERDRETMPDETYRQEYLAETLANEVAAFTNIDNCISGTLEEPKDGYSYVMGVDLAKQRDFTVIVIIHMGRRRVVGFERLGKADWTSQKEYIKHIHKKWNGARIVLDSHGVGDPILDDLRMAQLPISPIKLASAQAKYDLINKLRVALENETVHFPNLPLLVNELRIYRRKSIGRTGINLSVDRFEAPRGYHDDCVIALALAVHGCAMYQWADVPLQTTVYA